MDYKLNYLLARCTGTLSLDSSNIKDAVPFNKFVAGDNCRIFLASKWLASVAVEPTTHSELYHTIYFILSNNHNIFNMILLLYTNKTKTRTAK